jgi:hypothetical protein
LCPAPKNFIEVLITVTSELPTSNTE